MKNNKKVIRIVVALTAVLLIVAVGWYFLFPVPVHVSGNGTVVFHYDGIKIEEPLTEKESGAIANIVNGHSAVFDTPACGFSNKIGIRFSGKMISIACDNCPTLSVHGLYFHVSQEEADEFRSIMLAHGAKFPCI